MFIKSKHSGWLADGTRTPFGGGNPLKGITNTVSKALGTDGSGGGALGALAKIDPGPAIGKGLADVDKFVNREIPGGWITVGGVAAGGLAIAYSPQVMAFAAQSGMAPATAAQTLGVPGVIANGAMAGTPIAGSTAASLGSLGWTAPTIGGTAAKAGTFGALNAALPAAGASGFGSLSAALPAGAMFGTGLNGAAIGTSVMSAGPGQVALNAFGNPIQASSVGFGGFAPESSILSNAKKLTDILDQYNGGGEEAGYDDDYYGQRRDRQAGAVSNFNQGVFGDQPIRTIVDADKQNKSKDKAEANLFGLANILKDYKNYG